MIAQKHTKPVVASLLMSLESVFAVLAGWLLLNEILSLQEWTGCLFVFGAVVLAQLPGKNKAEKQKNNNKKKRLSRRFFYR